MLSGGPKVWTSVSVSSSRVWTLYGGGGLSKMKSTDQNVNKTIGFEKTARLSYIHK